MGVKKTDHRDFPLFLRQHIFFLGRHGGFLGALHRLHRNRLNCVYCCIVVTELNQDTVQSSTTTTVVDSMVAVLEAAVLVYEFLVIDGMAPSRTWTFFD